MDKILMIDDDEDDQYFYRDLFSVVSPELEFESIMDWEGLDSKFKRLESADYQLPKLILLDLNIPKVSGKQIFMELMANNMFKNIPIVALTTSSSPLDMNECRSMGFTGYFIKPAEFKDCKELVNTLYSYWFVFNSINRY